MRLAVVLFNLGGPDEPSAVRPFLKNLFNDPAIIGAPGIIRWLLSNFIAWRREPIAQEIYAQIGGRSPLLDLTRDQASALTRVLETSGRFSEVRVAIAMRYWHPLTHEAVADIRDFAPDRIVLLPLYPQFSSTTSGSSIAAWHREAARAGMDVPTQTMCCWPILPGFIDAMADSIAARLDKTGIANTRVLFSAHGLPERVIEGGDPYQAQVEMTAEAIVRRLGMADLDWTVCYQSRVGPLKWIGPSTDEEIRRAATDEKGICLVPVAFVSEHSETLVELDIEYREMAEDLGVRSYDRVATVCDTSVFIEGLGQAVMDLINGPLGTVCPAGGGRICRQMHGRCPAATAALEEHAA